MECKYMPKNDVQKLAGDAERNSRIYCSHRDQKIVAGSLLCLVLVLIISNVYLHYKCFALSKEVAEQRKLLEQNIKQKTMPVAEIHDVQKRNLREHRQRRIRGRRNARTLANLRNTVNFLLTKPVLHLDGFENQHREFDRHEYITNPTISNSCADGCFKWPIPSNTPENLEYEGLQTSDPDDFIVGIKIIVPGYYMVYSQVAINGPDLSRSPDSDDSPGYNLVVVHNAGEEILMESIVTQDERGAPYSNPNGGTPKHPYDTTNQHGVFYLSCGDIVLLKPTEYSTSAKFHIVTRRSYFGLYLTNPHNQDIDGNSYDCTR